VPIDALQFIPQRHLRIGTAIEYDIEFVSDWKYEKRKRFYAADVPIEIGTW
jgi:hypothetical protein